MWPAFSYIYGKFVSMTIKNKFSRTEELANAVSHFSGTMLAVAGLILMIYYSSLHGGIWHLVSTSVFGASMIILYFSSTMTHVLPMGRAKDLFFNIDRIAIYLLIAGTYTPLALVTLGGALGWVIFGIEWGFALTGSALILFRPGDFNSGVSTFYVVSYAIMGWLILIAIVPVINSLPVMGWLWILLGGLCYTLGIVFYKAASFRYHHLVWHLLVIAGSTCHFFMVFFFIIPR
jgi:hemolysin III